MLGLLTNVWSKIKTGVIAVLIAILPILYVLGRRDGSTSADIDRLRDAKETNEEIADFYRKMAEEPLRDPIRDRRDLIERLRSKGL